MNKKAIIETLQNMKGKTYQYAGKIHHIVDFKVDDRRERIELQTNISTYDRGFGAAEEFLSAWVEIISPEQAEEQKAVAVIVAETNLVDDLTAILKDNIRKVQSDAKYIPQAQAINNNVNSIINLTKLKLDIYKASRPQRQN
jgi:hypothetical protein